MHHVSYKFAAQQFPITWGDAEWALDHGIWSWADAVDLALSKMREGDESELELELGSIGKSDAHDVPRLVNQLAGSSPQNPDLSKRKWLYLTLLWLFNHKDSIPDALGAVEEVYADFDYPSEMATFVRYMPPTDGYDPSRNTKTENENRLIKFWNNYLEITRPSITLHKVP